MEHGQIVKVMRLIGNSCHFLEKIQENFLIHVYILQAKMKVTFTLFKINLTTYMQIAIQSLLAMVGKLKDTAEYISKQLGDGRMC